MLVSANKTSHMTLDHVVNLLVNVQSQTWFKATCGVFDAVERHSGSYDGPTEVVERKLALLAGAVSASISVMGFARRVVRLSKGAGFAMLCVVAVGWVLSAWGSLNRRRRRRYGYRCLPDRPM